MPPVYDNWGKLVAAVVKREQLWQLCHEMSRSSSLNSESSSRFSFSLGSVDDADFTGPLSTDFTSDTQEQDKEEEEEEEEEKSCTEQMDAPVAASSSTSLSEKYYMKMLKPFWKPFVDRDGGRGGHPNGRVDGLLWSKDLGNHTHGEYSMAAVQANNVLEDQSQLESGFLSLHNSGPCGTFIGVYDGHGGPETARFVNQNFFPNLKKIATEHGDMSAHVIKKAFLATDDDFLSLVQQQWLFRPQIACVGTCCLVGVICNGLLYIANAGDSRAVLGRAERGGKKATAVQMSTDHNANLESVREELRNLHPDDSQIVVFKHNIWRVKGLVQFSRSIGDAYLKKSEINGEPLLQRFRLPEPFSKPILSAEPSVFVHKLSPEDQFLIFASDGLWEMLSNQEAVDIVQSSSRNGIAKRLIKAAVRMAAEKREMRYAQLKRIDRGVRRHFHDDITVVVVYIDQSVSTKTVPVTIRALEG